MWQHRQRSCVHRYMLSIPCYVEMYSFFTSGTTRTETHQQRREWQPIEIRKKRYRGSHDFCRIYKTSSEEKAEGKTKKRTDTQTGRGRSAQSQDSNVKLEWHQRKRETNRDEQRDRQNGMQREKPLWNLSQQSIVSKTERTREKETWRFCKMYPKTLWRTTIKPNEKTTWKQASCFHVSPKYLTKCQKNKLNLLRNTFLWFYCHRKCLWCFYKAKHAILILICILKIFHAQHTWLLWVIFSFIYSFSDLCFIFISFRFLVPLHRCVTNWEWDRWRDRKDAKRWNAII